MSSNRQSFIPSSTVRPPSRAQHGNMGMGGERDISLASSPALTSDVLDSDQAHNRESAPNKAPQTSPAAKSPTITRAPLNMSRLAQAPRAATTTTTASPTVPMVKPRGSFERPRTAFEPKQPQALREAPWGMEQLPAPKPSRLSPPFVGNNLLTEEFASPPRTFGGEMSPPPQLQTLVRPHSAYGQHHMSGDMYTSPDLEDVSLPSAGSKRLRGEDDYAQQQQLHAAKRTQQSMVPGQVQVSCLFSFEFLK
jgi:hypothetical protein